MTNYFELFDLPVSFHPDVDLVKKKYYGLSRQYHPDRFAQTGGSGMVEALQMSAQVNGAFKVLKDSSATMAYVLKLHNLLEHDEKYSLPPAFLMEMMDLNELVSDMEPSNTATLQEAETTLNSYLQEWETEVQQLTTQYDAGDHGEPLLLKIKDCYFRKKYLLRIKERVATFATH